MLPDLEQLAEELYELSRRERSRLGLFPSSLTWHQLSERWRQLWRVLAAHALAVDKPGKTARPVDAETSSTRSAVDVADPADLGNAILDG